MLSLGLAIVGLASVATRQLRGLPRALRGRVRGAGSDAAPAARPPAGRGAQGGAGGAGLRGPHPAVGLAAASATRSPFLAQILCVLAGLAVCEGFTVTGRAVLFGLQRFGWMAAIALLVQALKLAAVTVLWIKGQGLIMLALLLLGLGLGQGCCSPSWRSSSCAGERRRWVRPCRPA